MSEIYDQAKFQQCTHGHVSANKHSSSNFSTPNHSLVYGLVMLVMNDSKAHTGITRTMHAHDASRRAAPVRMCAMRMRVGHVEQMSEISNSSRTTTVEPNMKSEHNLYLACEDLRVFFFCTFSCSSRLALLASTVH